MLVGLAAVTTSVAPRETTRPSADSGVAPVEPALESRAGAPANVHTTADVPSEPPLLTLDARRTRQRVRVRTGERVRLAIRSPGALASVQVGPDGPIEAIDPVSPARFDLLYESPRTLPIRVRDAAGQGSRVIGRLEVAAAG